MLETMVLKWCAKSIFSPLSAPFQHIFSYSPPPTA